MILGFPPHEKATPEGLLALGGDVEPESLLLAYRNGIFPWPILGDETLAWFSPPERAVLYLRDFKISRSMKKARRNGNFEFRFNTCFNKVIEQCALSRNRGEQQGTWITDDILEGYRQFHLRGWAHSVECFKDELLVGGLYGVSIGRMFAGESMFYLLANSSKLCLWVLIEHLQDKGVEWIDCQQMTPLFDSFGAQLISRDKFLELLADVIDLPSLDF
jgi:leucyl/phenylalanyl-tRNA--protein transferase